MSYELIYRVLDLTLALQAPGRGLSQEDVQQRYDVSRATARRMLAVVRRIFPELYWERGPDRRRYWKLRRGCANGLTVWSVDEIRALEAAARWARQEGRPDRERALRSAAEKVKAQITPPRPRIPRDFAFRVAR